MNGHEKEELLELISALQIKCSALSERVSAVDALINQHKEMQKELARIRGYCHAEYALSSRIDELRTSAVLLEERIVEVEKTQAFASEFCGRLWYA